MGAEADAPDRGVGRTGVELDKVELLWLQVSAQCGCGKPLARLEQVGFEPTTKELLCLGCLADLTAGRQRPSHRPPRPGASVMVGGASVSRHQAPVPAMPLDPWAASSSSNPTAYPPRQPRRPRRNGPGTAGTLVVSILLVALAVLGIPRLLARGSAVDAAGAGRSSLGDIALGAPIRPVAPSGSDYAAPPVPADARATRLSPSPPQRSSSTAYTVLSTTTSGRPVGFDPCRPIHIVVNTDEAPRGGQDLVKEAAAEVSAATGLVLTVDGRTTEAPTIRRRSVDEGLYGNRWAPVMVAWTHESANSELAGRVVGVGGPAMAPYRDPADLHYVTGAVLLDAPAFDHLLDDPDGRITARSIVMHELGHLVGLGHVADQRQLMFESMVGQTGFGDGDLEGLRRLGSGPCFSG